jgi:hypothetical protein
MKKRNSRRKSGPVVFEHRRRERHHPETGSIVYEELRGARISNVLFLHSDFEDTFSMTSKPTGYDAKETYLSFLEAADFWLKDAGEKRFADIAEDAASASTSARTKKQRELIERRTFQQWAFEIGQRRGFLSPETIAAEFITASDLVHRLVKGDAEVMGAIYQFAEAWHWLHFEGEGEHELADIGLRSAESRAIGPAVKQQRAAIKKRIIKQYYEKLADAENGGAAPKRAKSAAPLIKDEVNIRLKEELGLRPMTEKALIKELYSLVSARFPKGKKAS